MPRWQMQRNLGSLMMEHSCRGMTLGDHSKAICTICRADLNKPSFNELVQAIERVREVIEKHWNENICSLSTYQEIIQALDGEK